MEKEARLAYNGGFQLDKDTKMQSSSWRDADKEKQKIPAVTSRVSTPPNVHFTSDTPITRSKKDAHLKEITKDNYATDDTMENLLNGEINTSTNNVELIKNELKSQRLSQMNDINSEKNNKSSLCAEQNNVDLVIDSDTKDKTLEDDSSKKNIIDLDPNDSIDQKQKAITLLEK